MIPGLEGAEPTFSGHRLEGCLPHLRAGVCQVLQLPPWEKLVPHGRD